MRDDVYAPAAAPSLSVVIPSRNRHDLVVGVVERLLSDDGFLEVVVVDDGSTDGTTEDLSTLAERDHRLRVVPGDGKGASEARALGTSRARGDIVLFLDDDVMPDPQLAQMHLRHHSTQHPQVVVGYMPTSTPDHPDPESFATVLYADEYEKRCEKYDQDPSRILRNLWMGNVSMPREIFLDVTKRWPEPLPKTRHEDQHIGLRLASLGMTAHFDRELRAAHHHHRTLNQFRGECRLYGAGRASLEQRHPDMVDRTGVAQFREGLNRPLAMFVAASANKKLAGGAAAVLATTTWALGAFRLFHAQMASGRLLRRIELQQGYLSHTRASDRVPTS